MSSGVAAVKKTVDGGTHRPRRRRRQSPRREQAVPKVSYVTTATPQIFLGGRDSLDQSRPTLLLERRPSRCSGQPRRKHLTYRGAVQEHGCSALPLTSSLVRNHTCHMTGQLPAMFTMGWMD